MKSKPSLSDCLTENVYNILKNIVTIQNEIWRKFIAR